jgi:hypothetical protein
MAEFPFETLTLKSDPAGIAKLCANTQSSPDQAAKCPLRLVTFLSCLSFVNFALNGCAIQPQGFVAVIEWPSSRRRLLQFCAREFLRPPRWPTIVANLFAFGLIFGFHVSIHEKWSAQAPISWLPATCHRLPAPSYRLPAISYRPPASC